ncbi:hypothetical protein, partial [Klebsiella pneumoniae]|uniref:hypothetical protein n=1 Tax=Klebsiella pneumoniae TaxID=573 RepID=UPI00312EACCE
QDDKGWDARKRAYCLKIQPATGSFARNLIYSTKPPKTVDSTVLHNTEISRFNEDIHIVRRANSP